jgi:hypothetical protein
LKKLKYENKLTSKKYSKWNTMNKILYFWIKRKTY